MAKIKKKSKKLRGDSKETIIQLEQKLPEVPDRDPCKRPTMHLIKDGKGGYYIVPERRPSKTLLVEQIRKEVDAWRDSGYTRPTGISNTSLRLLEWWFDETHYIDGEEFKFYFCQREAIETIIYLYELKGIKDNAILAEQYMDPQAYADDLFIQRKRIIETAKSERILVRRVPETGQVAQQELPPQDLTRYAVKMATGSGKTLVMALLAVWSYFHRKYEKDSPLSKTFLIIAPNVIVFERLRLDFENGTIFTKYPMLPPEWKHDWQMTCIMRGESRKSSTEGTLYLTNIHQLYEDKNDKDYNGNPVQKLLGSPPKADVGSWEEDILERIKKHDELLIMNDEAHHVHDVDLEWYKVIMGLHENLKQKHGKGLSLHLDFSATPKDQNGTYFPWIICDYPLAQAIEDRIVKAPLIVHQVDKVDPVKYSRASVAYAEWINTAISRWKEHYEAYGKVKKKPVLFIMAEDTKDADDIYEFLQTKEEFKGNRTLLIHTDKKGEISKKDLKTAREAARSIDLPENKIRAVVSVMMLREGWDVQNVSVILGLRPFTSKANILPEQAVGRGLRLMRGIGPQYVQIVELIGTQAFEDFVRGLEVEGVGVGTTTTPPPIGAHIYPVKIKNNYDIEIPVLTPSHTRIFEGLSSFDLSTLKKNPMNLTIKDGTITKVELIETVTQKKVGQKQVVIDTGIPESREIIAHLTQRIIKEARLEGQFALVVPIVKKYIQEVFFGTLIDLDNESIRRQLSRADIADKIVSTLAAELGKQCTVKTKTEIKSEPIRLMETEGFYWRRDWTECEKTVFNITPCFNDFEKHFAGFLDHANDITKFAKLAESYTRFSIEYLGVRGAIRIYYPDFIAEQNLENGERVMWLIETKGQEDPDVPNKDARAEKWCKEVTKLTGIKWSYLKVAYNRYKNLTKDFTEFPVESYKEFNEILLKIEPDEESIL
jgi:type III restriction enzyme